jgi:hypothetical protein
MNFLSNCVVTKVADHTTAGTTDVETSILDMAGFEWIAFITSFGTAAVDNLIKVQQDDLNGAGGMADLLGTGLISGASPSNEDVKVEVYRPTKRYVRAVVVVDTSSTVESVYAIRGGARNLPVTNSTSGTDVHEITVSPAEGTA